MIELNCLVGVAENHVLAANVQRNTISVMSTSSMFRGNQVGYIHILYCYALLHPMPVAYPTGVSK